jgi:hypothetical protein
VIINATTLRHLSVSLLATALLTSASSGAVSRISLGAVGISSGPLTEPTVVDFGSLSGDTTYEFAFNAIKSGASTAIAGNSAFAIKLDQWNETGVMGTTQFGLAGQSVDSVFNADLHVAIVNDTSAADVRLYLDGEQVGSLAGSLPLADLVTVMGASDPAIDVMGDGSVMYGWATYDSALSPENIS